MPNLYELFKKLAFRLDPETVHEICLEAFVAKQKIHTHGPKYSSDRYALSDGHMKWHFPIGMASGFDKNARVFPWLFSIGFGAVELGTVTVLPQAGNPKPRIFRLTNIQSLRNAMGFPGPGMSIVAQNIKNLWHKSKTPWAEIIGVNIGKNKDTPNELAQDDYQKLAIEFAALCDYLVINISSPNTQGLRSLQSIEHLIPIIQATQAGILKTKKIPLYLKISPDLSRDEIHNICQVAKDLKISGIIATNTTSNHDYDNGGISGSYLKEKAKIVRRWVTEELQDSPHISTIGVGGVDCIEDLFEFWKQGGFMMQIYTSFIYQGPEILNLFHRELDKAMHLYQVTNVTQLREKIRAKN